MFDIFSVEINFRRQNLTVTSEVDPILYYLIKSPTNYFVNSSGILYYLKPSRSRIYKYIEAASVVLTLNKICQLL